MIKNLTFKKGMLIYIGVLVLLLLVSQIVLWSFLSSYQESLPETTAREYLDSVDEETWKKLLTESIYGSPFSDKTTDVVNAYNTLIKDKSLKIRRSSVDSKEECQVFKIYGDDVELCKITLTPRGNGSFGMARWGMEKKELSSGLLERVNPELTVFLPSGAGFEVNDKYAELEGELTQSPYITPFEKEGESFVKYTFRAPCDKTNVRAKSDGKELKLAENDGNTYIFDAIGGRIDQSITVPEGAEVYVNDIRLTTEYISDKGVDYPFLNPLEINRDNVPKSTVYTVKGLYNKPTVKVVYNGEELTATEKGKDNLAYAFNEKGTDYSLEVPSGAAVKVNGVDISGKDEYIKAKDLPYADVLDYEAELVNPVRSVVYSFKGMLFAPDIEVTNTESGESYTVVQLTKNEYGCKNEPVSEELLPEYEKLAEDFTVAMMEYMFYGREMLAETFARALSLTRKDSEANRFIRDSYSGVYWRREHNITYNSLYVDNYKVYADNAFKCDVHYDVTGNAVSVNRVDYAKGIYRLLFIKNNDGWEVVGFALIDE